MQRIGPVFRACLCCVVIAGCSGDRKVHIRGEVRLDGRPVDYGTIRFEPVDGRGPTDGAPIQQGRYSARVTPGLKRVQIDGYREVGREKHDPHDPHSPEVPVYEPCVPEQFNARTRLQAEISPGCGPLDFQLQSDG
jgi:hypothetical protein